MSTQTIELIYLELKYLKMHARNMRRFFPQDEVETMAASILGHKGVLHALQVVPHNEEEGTYLVIDGNLRLQAARLLGHRCPPLKCEVVTVERAEQLLIMVTDKVRFDPDPISEALHYQRLIMDEGLGTHEIADRTGRSYGLIMARLKLLRLDEPIQALIAEGRLPKSEEVTTALLSIPEAAARIKLAERLAISAVPISQIQKACARVAEQVRARAEAEATATPLLTGAVIKAREALPGDDETATWTAVRQVAREMCDTCDIKQSSLAMVDEPAWAMIAHAAGETCAGCNVRLAKDACRSCPGVEMLSRLIKLTEKRVHA